MVLAMPAHFALFFWVGGAGGELVDYVLSQFLVSFCLLGCNDLPITFPSYKIGRTKINIILFCLMNVIMVDEKECVGR